MKSSIFLCAAILTGVVSNETMAQMPSILSLELNRSQSSEMGIKDSGGNALNYSVTGVGASLVRPVGQSSRLIASLEYQRFDYDFDTDVLWQDVEAIGAFVMSEAALWDRWSLMSIGFVNSAYESGVSVGDAVTWGLAVGGKYQRSDTFSYLVGIATISRLEGDPLVLPVLGFEWQVNDRLAIHSMLGLEVIYDLSGDRKSLLELGVDYNLTDFRLDEAGVDGASRAIRPEGVGVYLEYQRQLLDRVRLSVKLTGMFEQTFETREDGKKISEINAEGGIVGAAGFTFVF